MIDAGVEGEIQTGDFIVDVYLYLAKKIYPDGCKRQRKRTIRRKAEKFVVREGQLFYINNKGDKVVKPFRVC